uniref:Uncharacterized protein n=1 Tax=Leptobrachium leishanense TaxID=445787 RepID=A0A8C5P6H0_9ANUR
MSWGQIHELGQYPCETALLPAACAAMSPHADFDKAAENIRKLKTKPTDDEMWGIYDLYNHNKGLSKEDAMALIEKYGI